MTTFTGTSEDEVFFGDDADDVATGGGGDDVLFGGLGRDFLTGNAGEDVLNGEDGDDILFSDDSPPWFGYPYGNPSVWDVGSERDTLNGGAGDDMIFAGYGDNVDGGDDQYGDELHISFRGATSGVHVDFRNAVNVVGGGTIQNIEGVQFAEGSEFNDYINLQGGDGASYMNFAAAFGRGGDDHLIAHSKTSSLSGDDGNDILDGRNSGYLRLLEGGAGNDTLYSYDNGSSDSFGGNGDDTIYASGGQTDGGAGDDLIILDFTYYRGITLGGDGDDEVRTSIAGNTVSGGSGGDLLIGEGADDVLAAAGLAPDNTVDWDLGPEIDTLLGGGGDDVISIGYGDTADGGTGNDTLHLSLNGATGPVTFSTASFINGGGSLSLGGGTIQGFERLARLRGSDHADTIEIATQSSRLTVDAGGGNDVVTARGSSVTLTAWAGDDRFISGIASDHFDGGEGNDTIDYSNHATAVTATLASAVGPGGDTLVSVENLTGSAFDDTLSGNLGANTLDGGAGVDTVTYASATSAVTVDLGVATAQNTGWGGFDTLRRIENVLGSGVGDTLTGSNGANRLDGAGGDDVLEGRGGADELLGGAGVDLATYARSGQAVTVRLWQASGLGGDAQGDTFSGIENVQGSNFGDTLEGSSDANRLDGAGGSDRLSGREGDDVLLGGGGDDAVSGGDGIDELIGGGGDDWLVGGAGGDTLSGGAGSDTASYEGSATGVSVSLGAGNAYNGDAAGDVFVSVENLSGSSHDDHLTGWGAANVLSGAGGDDLLDGDGADDILDGGDGDDVLIGGLGADRLNGGSGVNTASYAGSDSAVSVSLGLGLGVGGHAEGDALIAIQSLIGSAFDDALTGDSGANELRGGAGGDVLLGGGGADSLAGDEGSDNLNGGAGDDVLSGGADADVLQGGSGLDELHGGDGADGLQGGTEDDMLYGDAGDDSLNGGAGADALVGGAGSDTASYLGATVAITVNLTSGVAIGGWAQGDVLTDIENLYGSNKGDVFTGSGAANVLNGAAGDDVLYGLAGDDVLQGGAGDDQVKGGEGLNTLYGGDGNDTVQGGNEADTLNGGDGNDLLQGSAGQDILIGAAGVDQLQGGAGDDELNGGAGNDVLNGGDGSDRFIFLGGWGEDRISGFSGGAGAGDVIVFSQSQFANFEEVLAAAADDGVGNCVITSGANSVTLTGVTRSQLNADDFAFTPPASTAPADAAPLLTAPSDGEVLDPLVLPAGFEGKTSPGDLPQVLLPPAPSEWTPTATEADVIGLAILGRGDLRDYAWIV